MQRRILTMIATVCVIIFCAVSYQGIRSLASSGEEQVKFKYYTQVTLAYGETLWDLSETDYNISLHNSSCMQIVLISRYYKYVYGDKNSG